MDGWDGLVRVTRAQCRLHQPFNVADDLTQTWRDLQEILSSGPLQTLTLRLFGTADGDEVKVRRVD